MSKNLITEIDKYIVPAPPPFHHQIISYPEISFIVKRDFKFSDVMEVSNNNDTNYITINDYCEYIYNTLSFNSSNNSILSPIKSPNSINDNIDVYENVVLESYPSIDFIMDNEIINDENEKSEILLSSEILPIYSFEPTVEEKKSENFSNNNNFIEKK